MKRGAWGAETDRLWAASDEGVVRVLDLVALGLAESTAYRRCRKGGPWQRLAPGIVGLFSGEPTRRQREIAALLHAGPDAVLTGLSAARHHGLQRSPEPTDVHVLIRADRQVRSIPGVTVERTVRPPRPVLRNGLPVAPLDRAVLDAARRMKDPVAIAALLAEPVQRRMVHPVTLMAELDAGCRKGSSAPRSVLRSVVEGIRSAAEFTVREWWEAQPDLPKARFNVRVIDAGGDSCGIVDILIEEVGLGIEVDSTENHFATPDQVARDTIRLRGLRSTGLHMISIRPTQHRDDPAGTRRDMLDAIEVARCLPPPRVVYKDDLDPR